MSAKVAVFFLFYCIAVPALAQYNMMAEAFREFSNARFWQYEEIPITWNMEGTIQAELNEGINNLFEEQPLMAEANFTKVLEKDSSLWQANYYRAAARKKLRKFKGARDDLQRVLRLHPNFYEGYVELAKVYHLRRENIESERALKDAIRLDKTKAVAYYLKGDIDLVQDQLRSAINSYKDCLAADSLFHDARIKLSLIDFFAKKNEEVALRHLAQVLEYDSLQKTALLFRSIMLYKDNKKQSAQDLTNLILVSPHNLMARYLRGVLFTELKNYEQAFSDFQEVIKSTTINDNEFEGKQTWTDKKIDIQNVGAYTLTRVYGLSDDDAAKIKQAYCLILHGDFMLAIGTLNQTSNPAQEPVCLYLIAVAYEHKGDHLKAFAFYDKALKLDDEIADAHKKRGIYEQNTKQWNKSIDDFTTVLRLTPDAYVMHKLRGYSNFYNGNMDDAISDYNVYLKHDSTNRDVIASRGMAYRDRNERLNAYLDFAMSGTQGEFNFADMHFLVDSVLATGDTTRAMYCLNTFTEAAPYFTEGYVLKFQIHMARNEWKEVTDEVNQALRFSRTNARKEDHAYLLTLQAMHFAKSRHEEDALNTFTEAIKFDKRNALAYLERGKVLLAMGKTSKAESDLKQASALGNEQAKQLLASRASSGD